MASPTEQDITPKLCIVIKLPRDLEERMAAFPLLHQINAYYPQADLHLVCSKEHLEMLNLLPFPAFYHVWPDEEITWLGHVHRYAANLNIRNVDIFINLTDSFNEGALGLNLRAKIRLGFDDGWKKYLFNQSVSRLRGQHLTEQYFALWREHIQKTEDARLKIFSRDIEPLKKSEEGDHPKLVVNIGQLIDGVIDPFWIKFFETITTPMRVYFISEVDPAKFSLYFDNLKNELPPQHKYEYYLDHNWIDLAGLLVSGRGVVTLDGAFANFSAYVKTPTIILYQRTDPQMTGPFYFLCDIKLLGRPHPDKKINLSPEEVAREVFEFFRLSSI